MQYGIPNSATKAFSTKPDSGKDYVTMSRIVSIILLTVPALIGPITAHAQTCRVNAGRTVDGVRSYIEAYEYDFVSEKPTFPGGDRLLVSFINETRQYPEEAYRKGIQGRVTCSFIVNTDGSISHISVLRGVEPSLNQEAIRIMSKMPEWIPGKHDGQPVPVRVVWSVPFRK